MESGSGAGGANSRAASKLQEIESLVEKANGLNDEQKNRSFRVNRNFKTRQTLAAAATTELVSGNLAGLSATPSNTAVGA